MQERTNNSVVEIENLPEVNYSLLSKRKKFVIVRENGYLIRKFINWEKIGY